MMPRVLLVLCMSLAVLGDIPTTTPGFTFKEGRKDAPVHLEVFIDLLCPYSKAAYPALKKLGNAFHGKDFRLTFQVLPLPFHRNAFIAAQSAVTLVHAAGADAFVPWLETIYINQDKLSNAATKDVTPTQLIKQLASWATTAFPTVSLVEFTKHMQPGSEMDEKTRQLFRYSLAHGISGTPMFYLNGVHFNDADSGWSFDDWFKVIDPLVQANKEAIAPVMALHAMLPDRKVYMHASDSTCSGQARCDFADGKTMCCTASSEVCIVRYGCKNEDLLAIE
ncbi:unnamed protein product [Aphanomyces euteiches]|uniref:Thioredoxin-like fold domain-containing protein n=1 Tax=Aphanomyces euteiches TaxID=100861 RepID=A0A6G0WBY1_9STRA|nr:hypothetical protein Ae201684_016632 [Aphanomyces euteiches]KAH9077986.1 hypothetical protein Ae201684P_019092 [Aphanomyces euteiches]KAH9131979.1 hypothetical protein AeRB84_021502 [Aphanomyces euteiches]